MAAARSFTVALAFLGGWVLSGLPALADEPPPEALLAELPFLRDEATNRIIIDLAPQGRGKRFPLIVDTGATWSVITPLMARELGVRVRRVKQDPYRRATVLGRDLQFYVDTQSSDTGSKTGWEYGLLGGQFLAAYVVEFDFDARKVRFFDPRKYRVPEESAEEDATVVPLKIISNRPHAEVEINGQRIRVLVDTGAPFAVNVLGKSAREFEIESAPVAGLRVGGVLGSLSVELGEASWMGLGALRLAEVPVLVQRSSYNQGDATGALLGYDVLSQFLVRIDYKRRRMFLRRRPEAEMTFVGEPYARLKRTGAYLRTEDDLVWVGFVLPGSPADRLGLRPGDLIGPDERAESGVEADALHEWIAEANPLVVSRETETGRQRVRLPEGS